jgi:bifunctional enzyme CysN/CysC
MVTGASTADLAVILIDARKGVLTQTRRHSFLVSLIGIKNIVLAVNKMDLVGYDRAVFDQIVDDYRIFAAEIGLTEILAIPISGLKGDNITSASDATPWYAGPTLMQHLETVPIDEDQLQAGPLRLPVQWVSRPNLDFRGFAGEIASGSARPGERVRILPSRWPSPVSRSPSPWKTRSTARAAISSPPPTAPPRSPTSSRPPSSGWPRSRCCRAGPTG